MSADRVTDQQRVVAALVARVHPRWYRAGTSGQGTSRGEAVTLASLWRAGVLERRTWRGKEGEANTAHEYRLSSATCEAAGLTCTPAEDAKP